MTLLQLLCHDDVREMMLRPELWGVVGLWRLRGVCKALQYWATSQLAVCARVVAVGGAVIVRTLADGLHHRGTASVESLDLATLRWSGGCGGCTPVLPSPRHRHCACAHADGTVVVVGGYYKHGPNPQKQVQRTALRWVPGSRSWSLLPDLPLDGCGCCGAEAVALHDGRTMVIGGWLPERKRALSAVMTLSADGREWTQLAPLNIARHGFASALLANGRVLVVGGLTGNRTTSATSSAELWDPSSGAWTELSPMKSARPWPAACELPSGRIAVIGAKAADDRKNGEVLDLSNCARGTWHPLPKSKHVRGMTGVTAVPGGMVAVGSFDKSGAPNEMFDEEMGRWFTLPHAMIDIRASTRAVPVASAAIAAMWGPRPRILRT
eukprot:COSAG02_NODE_299_length_25349_cov_53.762020_12_plen_381_part_00